MFAYCNNNPVNGTDPRGYAVWGTNIVAMRDGTSGFTPGSAEVILNELERQQKWKNYLDQIENYVKYFTNTDEQVVLEAEYFAFYKGALVIKVPHMGRNALSFGVILLGSKVSNPETLKHEYGHFIHLAIIGIRDYIPLVAIPSFIGSRLKLPDNVYYSLPWEYTAEILGQTNRSFSYLPNTQEIAAFYWLCPLLTP